MNQIITISRQYGSGGHEIGEKLAQKLGYAFYDKQILRAVAARLGVSQAVLESSSESRTGGLLETIISRGKNDEYEQKILQQEGRFIRQMADKSSCVIIGRGANRVLSNEPGLFSIFVTAPIEARIDRIARDENLSREDAAKRIMAVDRKRAKYYNHHAGASWADADQYQLVIDRTLLEVDGTVAVLEYMATKILERKD